jgi:3-isopropylmalate dehydrogenase
MNASIVVLPGDGIGPEVTDAATQVLRRIATKHSHSFQFAEHPVGGASVDKHGRPLTEETLAACRASNAVLLGAVGGTQWEGLDPQIRPERGLLGLRKGLGVYANLRPVQTHPSLAAFSPLKEELVSGVDILIVRELTGGVYFGEPRYREHSEGIMRAVDTVVYTDHEIARVAGLAFRLAGQRKKKVTSVDKANVLETSRLWRETVVRVAKSCPDIRCSHMLVDTAAMRLMTSPREFDVVVTENMFGDILTDEAGVLAGSLGMLPSASLGDGGPGLYEPVHGSAPDIAGTGKANPIGAILSAALLLRYSLYLETEAAEVEKAVSTVLSAGARTADLQGTLSTAEMTAAVVDALR